MHSPADKDLEASLQALPQPVRKLLDEHGFSPHWLIEQARLSRAGRRTNEVSGEITPLDSQELTTLPEKGTQRHKELSDRGVEALRRGECALAVLAGGMATRMGGVIKALVPAAYKRTFLELRLGEQETLEQTYGKRPPLWLMTSHATHEGIEEVLADKLTDLSLALFRQGLSVRLTQSGEIFRTSDGEPSLHAPGHGDFVDSLNRSQLLHRFVEAGGKYILATNLDNLGGGLDPVLIGMHLEGECAVTCEVVEKNEGDRGGIPTKLDGKPVVLEEFRLPRDFDPNSVSVFNVNTFAFDAERILDLNMDWTYFEVTKMVEGKPAVQYERLINEVTFHLPTNYVHVPRVGPDSRFLPVKDHDDLNRYHEDLHAIAKTRGMIRSPEK
jgi:UTP--glucose-1-phosphate uridylyltransferase